MDERDQKDLFKRAAELASVVPEVMQPAAFNRALDLLMGQQDNAPKPAPQKARKRSRAGKSSASTTDSSKAAAQRRASTNRRGASSGRPGPKAMLDELIGSGFLSSGKTGAEIIDHQKQRRGHTYKPEELSPALVRLLRDGVLEREKNEDGIYEYTAS